MSPITRRILAVNVLALLILVTGVLFLGEYKRSLIESETQALRIHAEMFASAIAEGAVEAGAPRSQPFAREAARQMVHRLVSTSETRARLFAADGEMILDSRTIGPGGTSAVQVEELPPPTAVGGLFGSVGNTMDSVARYLPFATRYPRYTEYPVQRAGDYAETARALWGESAAKVRALEGNRLLLSVAVPVQRYKTVLGALMLSKDSREIERTLFEVRLQIIAVFTVVLAITVMLSVYLAGTIARPLLRLAGAAKRVRVGAGRRTEIPDLTARRDEIGVLSGALREMTDALWSRMDAIERFAADVAHEIKNPLSSLRSAVETAARIKDPDKRQQLMTIITDDVARLDRLISDISDASRIDAEMQRADTEPVDLAALLGALVEVESVARAEHEDGPRPRFEVALPDDPRELTVSGIEDRLGQVVRNLLVNAASFSPPGGTIRVAAGHDGDMVELTVEDQGPGIPEGKEEAIFQRFYSERPSGEAFGTHSGLGLSISRQIVEAHGGTIRAENRRDGAGRVQGARFVVRLPAAAAAKTRAAS